VLSVLSEELIDPFSLITQMLTFEFSEINKKGRTMGGCGKIRRLKSALALACLSTAMGLGACSSPVKVDGFDDELWKKDTSACGNRRIQLVDKLINNKGAILSHKDEHIMDYLGKPDHRIYFARGKKTLIYYITPSRDCPTADRNHPPKSMRIDIDALGRAELMYVLNQ
jgi:hypothetical protein